MTTVHTGLPVPRTVVIEIGDKGIPGTPGSQGPPGPEGPEGPPGASIIVKGSATLAEILAITDAAINDLWVQTDSTAEGSAGDGWVWTGQTWINVGPIQGPAGPPGADVTYTHLQESPSISWTVQHNLGKRPAVSVQDAAGNQIYGETQYVDDNTLVISFGFVITGRADCN